MDVEDSDEVANIESVFVCLEGTKIKGEKFITYYRQSLQNTTQQRSFDNSNGILLIVQQTIFETVVVCSEMGCLLC